MELMKLPSNGWVKLHRNIVYNKIFDNEKALKIWIWILLKANHAPHDVLIGRDRIHLQSGQFVFGSNTATEELRMSKSTIHFWLDFLRVERCIERKTTNRYSVITVLNYNDYQQADQSLERQKNAKRTPKETNNNDKNEKKVLSNINILDNTREKRGPNPEIEIILKQFYDYAGHKPNDRQPRNAAQVFRQQIHRLIKDMAPYKPLTFEGVVTASFEWYSRQHEDVRAENLHTVRRSVVNILFEGTRRKYIKS